MGSRNKRINSVLSDLDEIKRRQILSEISSIRIQSLIAILTVIGSAIAFMVIQRENISKIFKKEPALSYITNEQFVKTNGVLKIMDVNEKVVLKIDFRNLNKEFDLPSGSYTTKLIVNADTIWNESFVLKDNEHRKVVLPMFYEGTIKVNVTNRTPNPYPGEKIDVQIGSSGNGYLWIYEIFENNNHNKLFPTGNLNENEITADSDFSFPDGVYLAAGDEVKKEIYVFLVTSINDENYAQSIMDMLYHNDISKGTVEKLEKNWGVQMIEVNIIPPTSR